MKSHIESKERSLSEKSNFEKRELQITLLQLENEYALMEKRLITCQLLLKINLILNLFIKLFQGGKAQLKG